MAGNQNSGRPALPSNVHLLTGNRSKLPSHALRQYVQPETKIPKPPSHLTKYALAEWRRITPELEKLGLVSALDMAGLAAYCQAFGRWKYADEQIKLLGDEGYIIETPNGFQQQSVWLTISNRAQEAMRSFMGDFGLTPSARAKLQPGPQGDLFGDNNGVQQGAGGDPARHLK